MDYPGGETENVVTQKAAGFSGMFVNVRDYDPSRWDRLRSLCKNAGMFCGPWARMTKPDGSFDMDMLNKLITIADDWKQPFIVNAEDELAGTGATFTDAIAQAVGDRDAAISMQPWLFNPPSVDWTKIAHLPMLLQIFPIGSPKVFPEGSVVMKQAADCQQHAWDCGIKCVYFTFGTYDDMSPNLYDLKTPYSLFTGNEVGGKQEWFSWKPTSTGFVACKKEEESVTTPWYKKPYPTGKAVGPAKLPRILKPPSKNTQHTMTGSDVMAMKRIISKALRWKLWAPSTWDNRYNEKFAMGRGTGMVGDSGIAGFQRQEGLTPTGIVDDATYQKMRTALVPVGVNKGDHILDALAIKYINDAIKEFAENSSPQKAIMDFTARAEAHEELWHYTQARPFHGFGDPPEEVHYGDCSAYVILTYYWAKITSKTNIDDPSGYNYTGYGNTWDNLDGHPRVTSGNYLVGDLAHYNGHVTICKLGGNAITSKWSSFGSEEGPNETTLHYRPDLNKVVRPPL